MPAYHTWLQFVGILSTSEISFLPNAALSIKTSRSGVQISLLSVMEFWVRHPVHRYSRLKHCCHILDPPILYYRTARHFPKQELHIWCRFPALRSKENTQDNHKRLQLHGFWCLPLPDCALSGFLAPFFCPRAVLVSLNNGTIHTKFFQFRL